MDLPGVNAQEKTKEEIMEALRIGAQEILENKSAHTTVEISHT